MTTEKSQPQTDWTTELAGVRSPEQFAGKLEELRTRVRKSYGDVHRGSGPGHKISITTAHDLTTAKRKRPQRMSVIGFLTGCDVPRADQRPWLETYDRLYPRQAVTTQSPQQAAGQRVMRRPESSTEMERRSARDQEAAGDSTAPKYNIKVTRSKNISIGDRLTKEMGAQKPMTATSPADDQTQPAQDGGAV